MGQEQTTETTGKKWNYEHLIKVSQIITRRNLDSDEQKCWQKWSNRNI